MADAKKRRPSVFGRGKVEAAANAGAELLNSGKMIVRVQPGGSLECQVSSRDAEAACGDDLSSDELEVIFNSRVHVAVRVHDELLSHALRAQGDVVTVAEDSSEEDAWGKLEALSKCADELDAAEEPDECLQIVMRMKKKLLGPAARAARAAGLRQHSSVIALLQIALPAVRGEAMADEEREAIVYAARLVGAEDIGKEESRQAGRLMRKAGLDIMQLAAEAAAQTTEAS